MATNKIPLRWKWYSKGNGTTYSWYAHPSFRLLTATKEPIGPKEPLAPISNGTYQTEVSQDRFIRSPMKFRISTHYGALLLFTGLTAWSRAQTPAKIFYKYEGVSPAGSHKQIQRLPRHDYNMKEGIERLQLKLAQDSGKRTALATTYFGLKCTVLYGKNKFQAETISQVFMQLWGADVIPSPQRPHKFRKKDYLKGPGFTGKSWIAISEAIEDAASQWGYTLFAWKRAEPCNASPDSDSVLRPKNSFAQVDEYPDYIIEASEVEVISQEISFPFLSDKISGSHDLNVIGVEPTACPSLTGRRIQVWLRWYCRTYPLFDRCTRWDMNTYPPRFMPEARYITEIPR